MSGKAAKRKKVAEPSVKKRLRCILHSASATTKDDVFTSFSKSKGDPSEKLTLLMDIRNQRLQTTAHSNERMQSACDAIPESLDSIDLTTTGWHKGCYNAFTKHLDRLPAPSPVNSPSSSIASPMSSPMQRQLQSPDNSSIPSVLGSPVSSRGSGSKYSPRKLGSSIGGTPVLLPSSECLFCGKGRLKKNGIQHYPDKTFPSWKDKKSSWENIEPMAQQLVAADAGYSSLLRKVAGVDLFAAEAHYHQVCYQGFYSKHQSVIKEYHQSKQEEEIAKQDQITATHKQAYNAVKEVIKQRILVDLEVLPLTLLRDRYIHELEQLGEVDPTYRSENLHKNLIKDGEISAQLSFSKV